MSGEFNYPGMWGVAALMVVVASWVFYRYFAPANWREWASAGVVQAFIIALYAEMYGFPLTIYLLVRYFGIDRVSVDGNLWSTLFGVGPVGMIVSMLLGYSFLFIGIGLFAEGWRELYKARQEQRLVTDGLYAYVRHPQYTGLFLGLFGEGIVHWPTLFSVAIFPVIVFVYYLLARREEAIVVAEFGDAYLDYRRRVPMFLPGQGQWRSLIARSRVSGDFEA